MNGITPDILQYGIVSIVALVAIVVLYSILKKKNNGDKSNEILKAISSLSDNHLGEVNAKLDSLKDDFTETKGSLRRIEVLLVDIKNRINKRSS